jgi:hypothetical protein
VSLLHGHVGLISLIIAACMVDGTKASERDAEKTVDFLLGRLAKTNLIVKLKVLQIIAVRDPPLSLLLRAPPATYDYMLNPYSVLYP